MEERKDEKNIPQKHIAALGGGNGRVI